MEKTLGWRRYEVEGRAWADACVPPDLTAPTRKWLAHALRGALRNYECEVITRDGRRLLLLLEMSLIGRGREQGLLLTVQSVSPAQNGREVKPDQDIDYEIISAVGDFGTLQRISRVGAILQDGPERQRQCFEVLQRRSTPCPDCPVLRAASEPWPRTTIRRRKEKPESFEIVTAEILDTTSVRLSVRAISETTLAAIHNAKICELGDRARLSERERSVLTYLVMGRSLEDIGKVLDISARTVKFHQANVLEKLGADSRVDLVRLIL
jgi:PAS domain S-box-containing protein